MNERAGNIRRCVSHAKSQFASGSQSLTARVSCGPMRGMSDGEPAPTVAAPPPGLWARACFGEPQILAQLAERFWNPAYVWLRAIGLAADEAARQCRDFFSRMEASEPPPRDEPSAARFRDYVLAQLNAYVAMGSPIFPGPVVVEFDSAEAERRIQLDPAKTSDEVFNRQWSLRVLELSVLALHAEYEDRLELFDAMKPFLGFHANEGGYTDVARQVGMSTSALHLQVFNFRKRYRAVLRAQIADTVKHPDDVDSELTVLLVGAT